MTRLAERSGLSTGVIDKYRRGESDPSRERLVALARAAGVTVEWLATGEGPMRADADIGVAAITDAIGRMGQGRPSSVRGDTIEVRGLAECGLKGWYNEDVMAVRAARPPDLIDPDAFAVIAIGSSMLPAGIAPGFVCLCSPATPYDRGDAVFVQRDGEKASIKVYLGEGADWLILKGFLPPEGDAPGAPYTEKIARSAVTRIATVVYVKRKL